MIAEVITHGIAFFSGLITGSYILKRKFEDATGMDDMLEESETDGDEVLGLVQELTEDLPDETKESEPMQEVQDLAESFQDGDAEVGDLVEKAEDLGEEIQEDDADDQ